MTATIEAITPSDVSAPLGWQELATDDGLRVVGAPDCTWFVLGPHNSVVATYPGNVSICVALALYRGQRLESEREHAERRSAMD